MIGYQIDKVLVQPVFRYTSDNQSQESSIHISKNNASTLPP